MARLTKARPAKSRPSSRRRKREKASGTKVILRKLGTVQQVSTKLREDSYLSPERRRIPFTV